MINITTGDRVRFRDGVKPRLAGMTFVVESTPWVDNCVTPPRPVVWLVAAEDEGKPSSRKRRRSGYVDELIIVPTVSAWVRIARHDNGPGLDVGQVTQLATFNGVPAAEIDGGRWVPMHRITEIIR